jgi:hypothetical protein
VDISLLNFECVAVSGDLPSFQRVAIEQGYAFVIAAAQGGGQNQE